MRVAIVGCGISGPAAALFLARDGHDVEIVERAEVPRAMGAGFLLQRLGQSVVEELGLADELGRRSAIVRSVDARTRSGRRVLDFAYEAVVPGSSGWGVHRGTVFDILTSAVGHQGIRIRTGFEVDGLARRHGGWWLQGDQGEIGPYDLVVGADGARSRLRRLTGLAAKDVGYPYGALWTVVPDPDGLAGDVLHQRYGDTRVTLGVLPIGVGQACIYWSIAGRDMATALDAGPGAWVERARPYADELLPLVERAADAGLLGARYRDVVVPNPTVVDGDAALVLIGDAAHAMSPQLGLGASLGLADARTLATCLRLDSGDLGAAMRRYTAARRAHIRWYTWCSRLMTPVFQSDLVPVGWLRDALLGPIGRVPWVRDQFVTTFMGIRTSPWTFWRGIEDAAPRRGAG